MIKNLEGLLLISSSTKSYILKEHNMSGFVLVVGFRFFCCLFNYLSPFEKGSANFPGNVDKDSKTEDLDYSVVLTVPRNRYCQT